MTLAEFASRYPEAVPLKNIDTETVAEALVDIFSRLGVPEEILSELGTQFVSECMKEVTRFFSIKQLTTTPYLPMCNGMTEKFNGTMKSMLKRLHCGANSQDSGAVTSTRYCLHIVKFLRSLLGFAVFCQRVDVYS